ncbi:MAG: hypothetical protein HZB41_13175 [Ignavibacteriae bacterium]|nr:hypothetical protein [Ignavibacteriota bacterium]
MINFKYFLILIFVIISFSCKENNPVQEDDYYNVKVLMEDIDCHTIYDIEFSDMSNIPKFIDSTQNAYFPVFRALNLPENLKFPNLKIKIKCRELQKGEERPCTFMGPSYNFIYILSAKRDE